MADYIRPTPRNPILGLLADAMMGGLAYMEDPRRTQQMRGVGGLLSDTGIAQTIDRLASGEPLTKGKGLATRMKPETAAAAMTLAPEAVPIGRAAMAAARATKGLPVGASVRNIKAEDLPNLRQEGSVLANIPVSSIEHGESAMPGGKLTWPGSKELIREYASRKTPFPPIEVISPDEPGGKWMVVDGSHRLSAAILRGDKTIPVFVSPNDKYGLELLGGLLGR